MEENNIAKKQGYTVTKTTVELYRFRHPSGMYWADITIDAGEKSGRISIASDFGNYSNYWGASGDFKKFLGEISIDYAADKFNASRCFDHHATLETFTIYAKQIKDKARRDLVFKEMKALEDCDHKEQFVAELMNSDNLMQLFDGCPELEYRIKPQFKRLWNEVWPEMLKVFKSEMEAQNG
jgi:hypothetical protein